MSKTPKGLSPTQIQAIIQAHRTRGKPEVDRWDRWIRMYFGDAWGIGEDAAGSGKDEDGYATMEVNYPYAFLDSLVAQIVPPNPSVTITPRDAERNTQANLREAMVNDSFRRRKLRKRLWRASTFASALGRGFVKTVWDFDIQSPNYRAVDPRNIFYDRAAEDWEGIRYVIEAIVMTKGEFMEMAERPLDPNKPKGKRFFTPAAVEKVKPTGLPKWARPAQTDDLDIAKDLFEYVVVYEVYDFVGNRMHFVLEDVKETLLSTDLPYRFVRNPYQILTFNECLQGVSGLSDIQLIEKLQRMLNELDTLQLRHAQASIPVTIYLEDLLDDGDTFAQDLLSASSPGDAIGLKRNANAHGFGVNDIIGHTPTANMPVDFERIRERIVGTIEFVLGLSQYQRGVVGVADVATEVALADTANRTRNGRRMQAIDDVVEELASATIALYEEFLPSDSVLPIRLTGRKESIRVGREKLGLRNPHDAKEGRLQVEALEWDYEVVPYSPTEDSNAVQLKNMTQYMEVLKQSPAVHQGRLDTELISKLRLNPAVMKTPEEAEQAKQALAMMAEASGQGGGEVGEAPRDRLSTAGGVTGPLEERGALPAAGNMAGGAGVDGNA